MFIGHFGMGFASKAAAPKVSLGTLFLASQFLDLLWPTLLLLGVERVKINETPGALPLDFTHYPISHSLLMALVWSALLAGVHFGLRREPRGSLVVGLAVLSHWCLDWVVHVPDLPLLPGGGPRVGLGLWRIPLAAQAAELVIFSAGVVLYLRATRPTDRRGTWIAATLVVFLLLIQISNAVGPPPPSATAVAWVGQSQWLLVAWGYWLDRHREPKLRPRTA